jgi:hypothetical protein
VDHPRRIGNLQPAGDRGKRACQPIRHRAMQKRDDPGGIDGSTAGTRLEAHKRNWAHDRAPMRHEPLAAPNSIRRKGFRRSTSRRTSMGMCGVGSPSRPRLRYIGVTLLLSIWERPQHSNEQRQAQLRLPGDRLANQPRPVDRPALIGANVRDSPNLGYTRTR